MWLPFFNQESQRRRRLASVHSDPLYTYLATPLIDRDVDCRHIEYLALDFETTGLDPKRDEIISAGYVVVRGMQIELATATHQLVRPRGAIPEASVVIHGITDDRVAQGVASEELIDELLEQLRGRVMIAHHARVELDFLAEACRARFGTVPVVRTVDTQYLARRRLQRRNQDYSANELRLFNLRRRYNLPRYRAHNALSDALATAELFIAQVSEFGLQQPIALKELLLHQ